MRIVILFHIDRDSKLPFKFNLAVNAANYYCIAKLHRGNHSATIPFGHLTTGAWSVTLEHGMSES